MLKSEQIKSAAALREQVVYLNETTQMTYAEIAEHLGLTKNQVRHQIQYDRDLRRVEDAKQPA